MQGKSAGIGLIYCPQLTSVIIPIYKFPAIA